VTDVVAGLLRGMRPRQWIKNVLVVAAPASAGVLDDGEVLSRTVVAVACFTMAAAGTYLVNDAADVEADRQHPTKRERPVASGMVPVPVAYVAGFALLVLAPVLGGVVTRWQLGVVIGAYVLVTLAYSTVLKHLAVVELVAVALGFVLRAIAGGAATGVPLSQWFLVVASFGSLFMVVGKRFAEATQSDDGGVGARPVLAAYPVVWLRSLRDTCVAVTLLAYCLFAFERGVGHDLTVPWYQLSILPVTLGLLRYSLQVERGQGAAPEDLVLSDRVLQLCGVVWMVTFGLGVVRA
jgi:decaprenyl-phosphate phosphoribosyltransferase